MKYKKALHHHIPNTHIYPIRIRVGERKGLGGLESLRYYLLSVDSAMTLQTD